MKIIPPQYFQLIFAGNYLGDHPEIISYERLDDQGFNELLIDRGNPLIKVWPQDFTIYLRGDEPIDYFYSGSFYSTVSSSAAEIIHDVAKGSVELLPVNTVLNDRPIGKGAYYVLNVLKSIEALNWEATVWTSRLIPYNDPDAHFKVIKPAFNVELLQGEHFFSLRVIDKILYGMYISKYLKEVWEERKCTVGLNFQPIKTVTTA